LKAIRSAVVDAAGVSAGLWLSYLFVLFYLLIAAAAITHRDLFLESPIKLPFLGVELPLKGFFWLGPALFLIVHAYVLLHFVLLSSKAGVFDAQLREQVDDTEVRTRLRRQLPINIFVQFLAGPREVRQGSMGFLLRLIAWISLVVGPVTLLVFFQLQFLPYHSEWITMWQRIAVVIDLVLLWMLWPTVLHGEAVRRWRSVGWGAGVMLVCISLVSFVLVFAIATFPGEWLEAKLGWFPLRHSLIAGEVDDTARRPTSLWSNRLVLPGFDVIDHAKFDTEAKIVAAPEMASLRGRHLEAAMLYGAILRKVDFKGADLRGASLFLAQLQSASLVGAQLQGALLVKAQLQGALLEGAELQGASLDNAQLQGASLVDVRLQGASLAQAELQGTSLVGAQLQGAWLAQAQLQGASLMQAQLQGAMLEGAQLQGASLAQAQLQGALLAQAQLQGAILEGAQLQGAMLEGAQLQGALLDNAQLQGALLDNAQLQGAGLLGAQLQGASLRQVFVWRADVRGAHVQDARIEAVATSPRRPCEDRTGVCDWSNSLDDLKRSFEHDIPESDRRTAILRGLERNLDPTKPLDGEEEMARRWIELQGASPEPDIYEEKLANVWRGIGCAADGAPFVLTGLVRTMSGQSPLFAKRSAQVSRLAADFLKEDCAGAHGISEDTRVALMKLREATNQTPAMPNSPPTKP
jgi:uncharacterized protein YjbI with pentapeptide repeats